MLFSVFLHADLKEITNYDTNTYNLNKKKKKQRIKEKNFTLSHLRSKSCKIGILPDATTPSLPLKSIVTLEMSLLLWLSLFLLVSIIASAILITLAASAEIYRWRRTSYPTAQRETSSLFLHFFHRLTFQISVPLALGQRRVGYLHMWECTFFGVQWTLPFTVTASVHLLIMSIRSPQNPLPLKEGPSKNGSL